MVKMQVTHDDRLDVLDIVSSLLDLSRELMVWGVVAPSLTQKSIVPNTQRGADCCTKMSLSGACNKLGRDVQSITTLQTYPPNIRIVLATPGLKDDETFRRVLNQHRDDDALASLRHRVGVGLGRSTAATGEEAFIGFDVS